MEILRNTPNTADTDAVGEQPVHPLGIGTGCTPPARGIDIGMQKQRLCVYTCIRASCCSQLHRPLLYTGQHALQHGLSGDGVLLTLPTVKFTTVKLNHHCDSL
jgi:hypothetical protein